MSNSTVDHGSKLDFNGNKNSHIYIYAHIFLFIYFTIFVLHTCYKFKNQHKEAIKLKNCKIHKFIPKASNTGYKNPLLYNLMLLHLQSLSMPRTLNCQEMKKNIYIR